MKLFRGRRKVENNENAKEVLLLIDWDNLFLSLHDKFSPHLMIEERIKWLITKLEKEVGKLLHGIGWVFSPTDLDKIHRNILDKQKLRLRVCFKKRLDTPRPDGKIEEDTVDQGLIEFGTMMLRHRDVGTICLVSGDSDYIPFLKLAKQRGIKTILAIPTTESIAKNGILRRIANKTFRLDEF